MNIKRATQQDLVIWAQMRNRLWPNAYKTHLKELSEFFDGTSIDIDEALILENQQNEAIGFIEINIRSFAEGSRSAKVPYIEAWYIEEDQQGKGYGKALMSAAEQWAKDKGFTELASDTEIENTDSIDVHKKLGFKETERIVCFLKKLR